MKKKSAGNVMNMVAVGITILAMAIVVSSYLDCTYMMQKKLEIGQISRKYILEMETKGYLEESSRKNLIQELQAIGMQGIDLSGTTLHPVSYGETVALEIKGTIRVRTIGEYEEIWEEGFEESVVQVAESRQSTAKN